MKKKHFEKFQEVEISTESAVSFTIQAAEGSLTDSTGVTSYPTACIVLKEGANIIAAHFTISQTKRLVNRLNSLIFRLNESKQE